MKFTYRLATTDDIIALSILFKQVYIHTYGIEGVSKEFANFISLQFSVQKIESNLESEHCDIWVATFKNNLVGVAQVDYNKTSPIGNIVAPELNKLYILNRFTGKGIGQGLMQRAEQHLRRKGEKEIWLWVWVSNKRAIKFYQKQQYNWIGNAFFQMEVNKYENKVMSKLL